MSSSEEPQHIIAIGASAGGMEEILSFFDHTPLDGVAYVIVQHLSPVFKSRMVELVASHSKLEVKEAEEGMLVKCNFIYLIPNDKVMTIINGHLHLADKDKIKRPAFTINSFFKSLAADFGKRSIGVILSGLGADGTDGIKSIKAVGGMVIARNPETTAYPSMPAHAIATGMVDYVLEPAAMPLTIQEYVESVNEAENSVDHDDKALSDILELMKEKSPLDFTEYKMSTILRRTKRRAANNNCNTLEKYLEFIKATPGEIETLAQDFLISVTAFFRDKEAFNFIEHKVLPEIFNSLKPGEELKMWIAGCATGEEVYSMAMAIHEQLPDNLTDIVIKLFATDIDSVALAHAAKGVYQKKNVQTLPPELVTKYFIKEGNNYKIIPEIRRMVLFAQHDLVKNPPYCNMHLISCRNLLIYMTPVLQKKVFTMLLFGLKMDGYLFLGSSESPMPIIKNLEVVNKKWKIYKNLESKRVIRFDAFSLPEVVDVKHIPARFSRQGVVKTSVNTLAESLNVKLAEEMNALVVCIDENNQVIKSYGDSTRFLLQKNFNVDLLELLPKPLAIAVNTIKATALKSNERVSVNGITLKQGEAIIKVNISISPLTTKKGDLRQLMVTFTHDNSGEAAVATDTTFDEKSYFSQYTINIEEENKELKEKLHTAYELLDASNENMQSFNEELLSANEEMQSTNEEMQSVNEELDTINTSYQLKNKELLEINDDLNNYFRSNINGQLFINNELELMRFSPGTVHQINLRDSDIGRPLSHISTNIKFETIIDDIKLVLNEGKIITKEIETNDGKWYQIMTMPYIQQQQKKSNGAVITFNDITELKRTQLELHKKNKSLLRINDDLDNFVHTASHDLLAPLGNIEISIAVMNEMKVEDEEMNQFLAVINSSIKKFQALIKEIANVAKLESEMLTMELVDLDEIIDNIEWSLDDKIKESGAVITRDLQVNRILFSKKNLRSILYNLVSNSIKFKTDQPPLIHICSRKERDNVLLSVKDNGVGISKEDQFRIFNLYGRIHHDVEGHGIGLYLAKKIVDAAGGNILVESEPGAGSKFTIYLKAEQEPALLLLALN